MTEKPILFSAPMIRAILAGTKTQTRRCVKSKRGVDWPEVSVNPDAQGRYSFARSHRDEIIDKELIAPPYPVGTRLWVRETWQAIHVSIDPETGYGDDLFAAHSIPADSNDGFWRVAYRATEPEECREDRGFSWRSPRFMPRWASRITLEVTDVRVERLTDISEDDCKAEGIVAPPMEDEGAFCYEEAYADLWDSINGKKHPWESNVWVWAYTFRRVTP